MPDQYDFSDSTDWLPTPLAALAPLDSSLRCQVCKDFFTTPMMTSCSHTFCSLCIRRYLSQEGRCPACRESDQEVKLRRNWVVEELVANFAASRKNLLTFATDAAAKRDEDAEPERPKKRRKVVAAGPITNGAVRRSTRNQSKRTAGDASQQSAPSTQEYVDDSEEGSVYEDDDVKIPHVNGDLEPNDGLVACPCCHRRMKETLINAHLDKCISGESFTPVDDVSTPAPPKPQVAPPGTIAYTMRKPSKDNERLPFINYSILGDNALRKKLRDLGIPNHGSKELMRKRHTEWVNLWNANCDSTKPVTKRQLLQSLKVWEDTLGRQMDRAPNTGFMAKEFDRDQHVRAQKSNFDDLIQQARQRRAAATPQATEMADTDSRDGQVQEGSTTEPKATAASEVLGAVLTDRVQNQTETGSDPRPSTAEATSSYLHDDLGLHNFEVGTHPIVTASPFDSSAAEPPKAHIEAVPGSRYENPHVL
ncbi:E3 ubiquitin-protein ligase rad18 [Elasticomyces elasticus]|uniref:Postreplication repair E3 ubiquitin-protein ligase RAD18 n=1 Tax=Exophiala sideris TaxID=1016849 RepID=A0ABR0J286_9EURO|nr:E3 ubiquitin-protein ligase rad18 [Elasticomyces elasticus]KAK5024692.1 E3 ubiquitin-protein ligase rad18 [Exophiala sideris]KAK5030786.1 E3 ubiquitin-protein ligase rad18 [Exophiala sideris]KAK5054327.1 E3 ubiquitin-protein ligase rad18 [Exophiala sideris]KAK5179728.1 E3 ubiquitin-protein ligase rad18 [Eurotiomycetes sp. CCFEE 6388]